MIDRPLLPVGRELPVQPVARPRDEPRFPEKDGKVRLAATPQLQLRDCLSRFGELALGIDERGTGSFQGVNRAGRQKTSMRKPVGVSSSQWTWH